MAYILKLRKTVFKSEERSPSNELEQVDVGGKVFNTVEGAVTFINRNVSGVTVDSVEDIQRIIDTEGLYQVTIETATVDGFIDLQPIIEEPVQIIPE